MWWLLAVLLAAVMATGADTRVPRDDPVPAVDAPVPRGPAALAEAFTTTTRQLRDAGWDGTGDVPRDVTLLALYHQRILRLMAERRALGDAALAKLPDDVRGEARDTVVARRALGAIPRGKPPKVRVAPAAPASVLRAAYAAGERRFGVDWSVLAAVNFVESAFGRVRSASEAGARGPMQFLPATWREYGLGGDIDDPRDAILAAANYLHHAGASESLGRALFAYNHSSEYVHAVRRLAARMRTDERAFQTYYAWQVFVRTPGGGTRRVTGPGS